MGSVSGLTERRSARAAGGKCLANSPDAKDTKERVKKRPTQEGGAAGMLPAKKKHQTGKSSISTWITVADIF